MPTVPPELAAKEAVEGEVPLAHPVEGAVELALERQDQPHGVLGDRGRGVGGHPRDRDTEPGGRRDVDVVEAGAAEQHQPGGPACQRREHPGVDAIVDEDADRREAGPDRRGLAGQRRLEERQLVGRTRRGVGGGQRSRDLALRAEHPICMRRTLRRRRRM